MPSLEMLRDSANNQLKLLRAEVIFAHLCALWNKGCYSARFGSNVNCFKRSVSQELRIFNRNWHFLEQFGCLPGQEAVEC